MILTVDIGNTNIVLGGFINDKLEFVSRISTDASKTEAEYATKIKSILTLNGIERTQIRGAIVSSVVPPLNSIIFEAIKMVYGVEAILVGPGVKTGINLVVDNPTQVGADIICASVAAYNMYKPPVLVIDMGTATKLFVVDEKATFFGVSIIPGVGISARALAGGTAQLPQVSLEAPKRIIAKNTVDCMCSGIIYGNACMIDGMIDRIIKECGYDMKVVATGGYARTIMAHCTHDIHIEDNLLLEGLRIIYEKNAK